MNKGLGIKDLERGCNVTGRSFAYQGSGVKRIP